MTFGAGFTTGYGCRFEMLNEKNGVTLHFGKNCKLGDYVHIAACERVAIGDNCLMASHIFISDTNHGSGHESPLTAPDGWQLSTKPVSIGNNVWIGEGVAILPGSNIGDGCIIGAHAVVKGAIPDYTMVAGAPARPIKKYNFATKEWEKTV